MQPSWVSIKPHFENPLTTINCKLGLVCKYAKLLNFSIIFQ